MLADEAGLRGKVNDFQEQKALQTVPLGLLRVKVVRGRQLLGERASPYMRLTYRGVRYRTGAHEQGGKAPVWN